MLTKNYGSRSVPSDVTEKSPLFVQTNLLASNCDMNALSFKFYRLKKDSKLFELWPFCGYFPDSPRSILGVIVVVWWLYSGGV